MESVSVGSKKEERRKCLPLEIRMQMYDDVQKLHKKGLSYRQIQKRIYEEYGMRVPKTTISYWLRNKHHPLRKVNKFNEKPSPKLAYFSGAMVGDGSKCFYNENYRLRLAVKDYEFAEEFGKCLAKVLGRKEPYKPFWSEKEKRWVVEVYSILLFKFLDRPLKELKPYIEHCRECVAKFLRALFDAEGSIYGKILFLYNTDKGLLNYAKHLLKKYFDIDSTIYLEVKRGKITYTPDGKAVKYNKNYYCLYIRAKSLSNFYKFINFSIKRKQQRLIEAIKQ